MLRAVIYLIEAVSPFLLGFEQRGSVSVCIQGIYNVRDVFYLVDKDGGKNYSKHCNKMSIEMLIFYAYRSVIRFLGWRLFNIEDLSYRFFQIIFPIIIENTQFQFDEFQLHPKLV